LDVETIRGYCMSLPHVTEHVQWGEHLVFKVGGKCFAIANLGPVGNALSFKCSLEDFAELIEQDGIIPAPYLARAHWVALERFDALRTRELQAKLNAAYQHVFQKLPGRIQQQLRNGEIRRRSPKTKQP
jgi:predicted DNA-binding protein (MmcQ/YjbR family)